MRTFSASLIPLFLVLLPAVLHGQNTHPYPEDLSLPGPEQRELSTFEGVWSVVVNMGSGQYAKEYSGTARSSMIVGGRFLELALVAGSTADSLLASFILGFDRRNEAYQVVGMDSWGTYFVTATGKRIAGTDSVKVYGSDRDPLLAKMGHEKEFAYLLYFESVDQFSIQVILVDTRTEEKNELNFIRYQFNRLKEE